MCFSGGNTVRRTTTAQRTGAAAEVSRATALRVAVVGLGPRVLGAGPWTTFRRITLPAIRPGLVAGAIMAFLVSFDEAVVSLFLSGYYVKSLPVALLQHIETQVGPEVAALSVLLTLVGVGLMTALERVLGLRNALR